MQKYCDQWWHAKALSWPNSKLHAHWTWAWGTEIFWPQATSLIETGPNRQDFNDEPESYHDIAKDQDAEPEAQAKTQAASAPARPKRARFQSIGQPLPEVKERLAPNLLWRKEKETEGFHGWKEPESKERFGFDPSLVERNSMEAQEEDNDDSQLIKSQRTKWELTRGNQQAQSNLKDQAPSN